MELNQFSDGIYIIRTIEYGNEIRKVCERIQDLPKSMDAISLEPYRYDIAKKISKRLEGSEDSDFLIPTTKELIDIIFNTVKGK